MQLLRSLYYHASSGFPEAVPAGIIAVDLADEVDLTDDLSELSKVLTSVGIFDDSCFLLGFSNEDADLVRGSVDSETFHYVVSNQIVPNYQWELIKQEPSIRIYEVPHSEVMELMRDFVDEHS